MFAEVASCGGVPIDVAPVLKLTELRWSPMIQVVGSERWRHLRHSPAAIILGMNLIRSDQICFASPELNIIGQAQHEQG